MNNNQGSRSAACRAALAFAFSMCLSSTVWAQGAEGSLYGQATANATVAITNLDTGASREIKSERNGRFAFSKLSPGRYKVSSGGVSREVQVVVGAGTQVNLDAKVETIHVTGNTLSGIDISSVESNTVFTQEQLRALPVARDPNAVALLAPGVVRGDSGFGGLPSFAGASVAENGYYINGFDVTNIRTFLSYATLPFEAIGQQQIKTGGYGAEYGRSLGGVVSLVSKRGGNEWKSGVSMYWTPESGRAKAKDVRDLEPTNAGGYTIFQSSNKSSGVNVNVYSGGALIKDKLFVFALIDGNDSRGSSYGQSNSASSKSGKPNGLVKLDWQVSDNHSIEGTAISNKGKSTTTDYTNARPFSTSHDGIGRTSTNESGGSVLIGKYTGHLTRNLTVSALVGKVEHLVSKVRGARTANQDCPVVLEVNLSEIGCWVGPFPGSGARDPNAPEDTDKRDAWRLDMEWAVGNHTVRGGVDAQAFTSSAAGSTAYTGGYYFRYFVTPDSGIINGVRNAAVPGTQYVRRRLVSSTSGKYEVDNAAIYLEDSWRFAKTLLLYGGLRAESFNNKNAAGVSFVKKDNQLAPRIGFAWDVNGDATSKLYGNFGSYFIPVAANTNIRQTRSEIFEHRFYLFQSRDPRTQGPVGLSAELGVPQIIANGALPNPATIADTKLRPMSQDEFILGFQKALNRGVSVGIKGTHRKIKNGFDDYCGVHQALEKWAADNRFTNFDSNTSAGCILLNPGRDVNLQIDVNNDGRLREFTIPARYFGLAPYKRTYTGIELTFDRPFDGKWNMQGSYTWSKSKGTAEGYVSSIIDQADAGITQDFDFGSFTDGADGYLPNDRRHVFKLFGNAQIQPDVRLGFNASAASGRPKSCIGFVPPTAPDYAGGSANYTVASSYYCLNNQGVTVLVPRGSQGRTPWTYALDFSVAWTPKLATGKLTLQADIFNILNSRKALEVNEQRDYSRQTSGTSPGQLSQNYGQPTSFEAPRSLRLTARYEF